MRVVAERLQALTWAGAAGVFVPEDGGLVLCEASGSGPEQLGLRLVPNCRRWWRGPTPRARIRSEDPHDPSPAWTAVEALGARSAIVVPLDGEHGVQAVVAVWSDRPNAFHELHAHTIRLVAGLLSAALERACAFASNQILLAERTASLAASRREERSGRWSSRSTTSSSGWIGSSAAWTSSAGGSAREGSEPADFLGRSTAEIVGAESAAAARAGQPPRARRRDRDATNGPGRSRRGTRHMQTTLSPLRGARGRGERASWASGATSPSGSRPSSRSGRRRRWRRSAGSPAAWPTTSTT